MALTYPDPDLTDAVVRLRRWRETDIDCIRQAAMDPRIPEGTTVPALYTPDAGRALIRRQRQRVENGEGVSVAIVAAGSDEALGLLWLGIRPQAGVLGLGYWVVPGARRRGLANRATLLAVDWVLREAGIARVEAWVEPNNIASQSLLTAAGFAREGVLRSFLAYPTRRADAVVFSRIAQDGWQVPNG
jgi:ribosomal-protein-alanine N-acetyltransferase